MADYITLCVRSQPNNETKSRCRVKIECQESMIGMADLEIEVVRCLRSELDMDLDIEAYRNSVRNNYKELEGEFSKFLVKVPS